MHLTFDTDFEIVQLNEERYRNYVKSIKPFLNDDSTLQSYSYKFYAFLDEQIQIDQRLIEYLNRVNNEIPGYNYKSDIELYKLSAKANLDYYFAHKEDTSYLHQIQEYIFLYECSEFRDSWFFLRQPTLISIEFFSKFSPDFYTHYLAEKASYGERFKLAEPITNSIYQQPFLEGSDFTFEMDDRILIGWRNELKNNEINLREFPEFESEYSFVNELIGDGISNRSIILIK
jgi:hypothetical protein